MPDLSFLYKAITKKGGTMDILSGSAGHSSESSETETQMKFFDPIKRALEVGDFQEAERLHSQMMESDINAVSEAVKIGELIEKEMTAAIDKDHLALWPGLYDPLSSEERNCLFHSMKKYNLPDKRMLLKYGSLNNKLFFIEKGRVTVAVPQGGTKFKVLAQLGPGDVLGEYSFATIALCSATAVTKTSVQFRCLEGKVAETWDEKQPGLYTKVLDFCSDYGRIDLISARKEREVHTHKRYHVKGRVQAILLDKNGQETDIRFGGELEEISQSGTSFSIHCNNRATVKKLLTRSFALNVSCGEKGKEVNLSSVGKVVRVSFLLYNDYMLHIGFHTHLSEQLDNLLAS